VLNHDHEKQRLHLKHFAFAHAALGFAAFGGRRFAARLRR